MKLRTFLTSTIIASTMLAGVGLAATTTANAATVDPQPAAAATTTPGSTTTTLSKPIQVIEVRPHFRKLTVGFIDTSGSVASKTFGETATVYYTINGGAVHKLSNNPFIGNAVKVSKSITVAGKFRASIWKTSKANKAVFKIAFAGPSNVKVVKVWAVGLDDSFASETIKVYTTHPSFVAWQKRFYANQE